MNWEESVLQIQVQMMPLNAGESGWLLGYNCNHIWSCKSICQVERVTIACDAVSLKVLQHFNHFSHHYLLNRGGGGRHQLGTLVYWLAISRNCLQRDSLGSLRVKFVLFRGIGLSNFGRSKGLERTFISLISGSVTGTDRAEEAWSEVAGPVRALASFLELENVLNCF